MDNSRVYSSVSRAYYSMYQAAQTALEAAGLLLASEFVGQIKKELSNG